MACSANLVNGLLFATSSLCLGLLLTGLHIQDCPMPVKTRVLGKLTGLAGSNRPLLAQTGDSPKN